MHLRFFAGEIDRLDVDADDVHIRVPWVPGGIQGGRVVDPFSGTDRVADVAIADGKVLATGGSSVAAAAGRRGR